jgi:hypothetical protein
VITYALDSADVAYHYDCGDAASNVRRIPYHERA